MLYQPKKTQESHTETFFIKQFQSNTKKLNFGKIEQQYNNIDIVIA